MWAQGPGETWQREEVCLQPLDSCELSGRSPPPSCTGHLSTWGWGVREKCS